MNKIGAVLKDFTMSFWDISDNFGFEKKFSVSNYTPDYQTNIWYIEFLDLWLTTDRTHVVHVWDISKEAKVEEFSSPKIKSNIIDVAGLNIFKLIAVSSLDKVVTIWDYRTKTIAMELDLDETGIHTLKWSASYQVLVTAGYENNINLWAINPTYLDITHRGKLVGHPSMVTAIEPVEKTPMVISADDQGTLRVWDIRNLSCVQVVPLMIKAPINFLIDAFMYGKLCYVGIRVNLIDFEDSADQVNDIKVEELMWPLHVDYNPNMDEVIVCTRKDIRFIDNQTGRTKKIYTGLFSSEEDDITTFKLTQQNKKFLLGSERGEVNLYSYATGERVKSLKQHTNEVVGVKVDYHNNLTITTSWDSSLYIQKELLRGYELKRSIKNMHYNKEVTLMEISVHHNILITATNNNILYVWDYEYAKLVAALEIEENLEPTFLYILTGFPCIIIGDTGGKICFFRFKRKDLVQISFEKIGQINLNLDSNIEGSDTKSLQTFANKIALDIKYNSKSSTFENLIVYLSTNKGYVQAYDILNLSKTKFYGLVPHANTKLNYNADRINHEDFLSAVKNYKVSQFKLYALTPENTEEDEDSTCLTLNQTLIKRFKAHKDSLTTLSLLETSTKRLLTGSLDYYMKMWTVDGIMLCSLNINHPLPIKWGQNSNNSSSYSKKILYALKVIDAIFKRYKKTLYIPEAKKISVNSFIKAMSVYNPEKGQRIKKSPTKAIQYEEDIEEELKPTHTIEMHKMEDAYSPRDIQFEKAKVIFQKDLQGPSLRQMEATKRLATIVQTWGERQGSNNDSKEKATPEEKNRTLEEQKEKNEFMMFLLGDNRGDFMREPFHSERTKVLATKLESLTSKTLRDVRNVYSSSVSSNKQKDNNPSIFITSGYHRSALMSSNVSQPPSPGIGTRMHLPSPLSDLKTSKSVYDPVPLDAQQSKMGEKGRKNDKTINELKSIVLHQSIANSKKVSKRIVDEQSQSLSKIDFISYAQEKLYPPGQEPLKSPKAKEPEGNNGKLSGYDIRLKSKKFSRIIMQLDKNLKKSQTSSHFYMSPSRRPEGDSDMGSMEHSQGQILRNLGESDHIRLNNHSIHHSKLRDSSFGSPAPTGVKTYSMPVSPLEKISPGPRSLIDIKKSIEDVLGMKMDKEKQTTHETDRQESNRGKESSRGNNTNKGFKFANKQRLTVRSSLSQSVIGKTGFENLDKVFHSQTKTFKAVKEQMSPLKKAA